jgi:Bacterial SH3 domain
MAIDDDRVRASSTERREAEAREHPTTTVRDRRGSRTRIVLGSLLALLVVAAAVYYFAGHRTGTEVAIAPGAKQSSDSAAVPTPRRAADSADHPVASTSPQPDPSQSPPAAASPQQAGTASPPSSVTAADEMRKDPLAAAAQNATSDAPTKTNEGAAKPSESSGAQADARTGAPAVKQQPMQARPTSLPDQPAAAPKQTEVISIVKRGPANIRSAPGKNGRVIGTAAKDTQLREISRSGTWVEVETKAGRGWIDAGLLAPLSRESR